MQKYIPESYKKSKQIASSFSNSFMSLISSRLDISNLLSTKKKPWRESAGDFCFQTQVRLA